METKKNLTAEERKFLDEIDKQDKEYEEETRIFWKKEYPSYSREEKVRYWLASIHRGMRTQGEATGGEYSEFSSDWYTWVKSVEPNFDDIFKEVVPFYGAEDFGKGAAHMMISISDEDGIAHDISFRNGYILLSYDQQNDKYFKAPRPD